MCLPIFSFFLLRALSSGPVRNVFAMPEECGDVIDPHEFSFLDNIEEVIIEISGISDLFVFFLIGLSMRCLVVCSNFSFLLFSSSAVKVDVSKAYTGKWMQPRNASAYF